LSAAHQQGTPPLPDSNVERAHRQALAAFKAHCVLYVIIGLIAWGAIELIQLLGEL
jgi:hypothetical protein